MGFLSRIEEKLAPGSKQHEGEAAQDGSHIGYTGQSTGSGTGMVGGHSSNQTTGSSGVPGGLENQALRHETGTGAGSGAGSQGVSAKTAALMSHATSQTSDTPNLPGQFESGSNVDRSHDLRHPIQSSTGRDFAGSGPTTTTNTNTTTTTGTTAQYPTGSTSGSSSQYPSSSTTGGTTGGHSLRHPTQNISSNDYASTGQQQQSGTGVGQTTTGSYSLRHPGQNVAGNEYSGINSPTTSGGSIGQASSGYGSVQGGSGQYPTGSGIGQATRDHSSQGTSGQYQTGSGIGQASSGYGSSQGTSDQYQGGSGIGQASSGYGNNASSKEYSSTGQHGTSHAGVTGAGLGAAAAATGYEASRHGHHDTSDRPGHHNTSDKVRAHEPYDPYSSAGQKAAFDANAKSGSSTSSATQGRGSRSAVDDRETTSSRHGTGNSTMNSGPHQALENKDAIPTAGGEKLGGASGPNQGYDTRGDSTTGRSYADESSAGTHRHHDSHLGRDAAGAGGAGAVGAGAYESGKSSHREEKPSMMDKMLGRTGHDESSTGTRRAGHEETSTGSHRQHDSHLGREATAAGGAGAVGAGAYESGKSSHLEEKPSMMDKMLGRTGHEETSTGTRRTGPDDSSTGSHRQHDSHLGRDAAVAGGAGAVGAGAYESGKSNHHEEKPSVMDKMLHRTGHESSKDKTHDSHDSSHKHGHHQNTTDLANRSQTSAGHTTTSINPQDISYMNPSTSTHSGAHDQSTSRHHTGSSLGAGAGAGGALGGAALGFHNSSRDNPNDSSYNQSTTSGLGGSGSNTTRHDKTWPSGDSASLGQTSSSTTGSSRDHSGIGQHYQAGYEAGYQAGLREGKMQR